MTLSGQLFRLGAICSAEVGEQNVFTVKEGDLESSSAEVGDQVRVGIIQRVPDDGVKPIDREIFTTTLMPNGQVMIPNDAANSLDIEAGDMINYVVVPKSKFPSLSDGPLRDKVRGDDNDAGEVERGERTDTEGSFSGNTMRQTGQIRVPGQIKDSLALIQGDEVKVDVQHNGDTEVFTGTFGTGDRVTIPKKVRDKLGLEKGDQPTVTVSVTN